MIVLNEIKGDLFTSIDDCLVHCISVDLKMSRGIAVEFVKRFPRLRNQIMKFSPILIGNAIGVESRKRYIINLITKDAHYHKPTYESMELALGSLVLLCKEKKIKQLSMPKIGCGLDRLEWENVRSYILDAFEDAFKDDSIIINCYYLD